jgi:hypothetical protein
LLALQGAPGLRPRCHHQRRLKSLRLTGNSSAVAKLTVLTAIAGILALGEFGTAVMIGLGEVGKDTVTWPVGVVFGAFFLIVAWLLRSGRITAGAVFADILCLFVVVTYPSWYKHSALNWTYETAFAVVALAGLIGAITVLAGRLRHRAVV